MALLVGILSAVAVLLLAVIVFLINFYRDPEREIPSGNNVVSPADGRVISILRVKDKNTKVKKGLLGKIRIYTKDVSKDCYVVSIFMSAFDVHINRAPISGKVASVKREKGKFFAAFNLEKSLQNENTEVVIKNDKLGKIKVIQIAGFLARRIICRLSKSEKVIKGQRFGSIVLGSQATIIMPAEKVKIMVEKGQKVRGGTSIIAWTK